jgi:DNA-binding NtrC family response regulator
LAEFLDESRYEVLVASSATEAAGRLGCGAIDVVLAAARLPEGDAVAAFAPAHKENPALSVVVIAGVLDAPFASDAPPAGFDLLTKPLQPESVRSTIDRAAERGRLERENESLREELREFREGGEKGNGNGGGDATRSSSGGNGNGGGNGHALRRWIGSLPESFDLRSLQADVEREIVKRALAGSAGVAAQAARKLGLSRSDLAYKLRRLGIVREPR